MFRKSYTIAIHPANNIRKINLCSKMKISKLLLFCVLSCANITFAQWQHIATIGNYELRAVKFFNEHTGIVAGEGGIWRTTNSGLNWTSVWNVAGINSISFLDANTGLAAGDGGRMLKTFDGGLVWNVTVPISENMYAVDWGNATVCYAVGSLGRILKSTNSGNSWYTLSNNLTQDLIAVHMPDPGNGYIAGGVTSELFGSTVNGGSNWVYPLNQVGNNINDMYCFPSFIKVILVGSNGRIRYSTNFGTSWLIASSGTTDSLNAVYFIDETTGYIAGNNGILLKSTSGGLNWSAQVSSSTSNLIGIYFINSATGWAVGSNGTVLRTGIPVSINNNQYVELNKFTLHQNFPNPFNPETNITFDIDENSAIKISVYSISGHFIKVLLDDYMNIGSYSINFESNDLPSGVFFYKLETPSTTIVKKMVLIK